MEQHVDGVMPARGHAKKLTIEHVRQPGKRMPVRTAGRAQRPNDPLRRQAGRNVRVLAHVEEVIEINKVKAERLTEDNCHGDDEKTTNAQQRKRALHTRVYV